jgi:hypothetical protein
MTDLGANPGSLSERLAKLDTTTPPLTQSPAQSAPGTPITNFTGSVIDNGTNIGLAGRKASMGAKQEMSMERRTSTGGSGGRSRRGSGVVLTPSGTQVVYHTRTNVR